MFMARAGAKAELRHEFFSWVCAVGLCARVNAWALLRHSYGVDVLRAEEHVKVARGNDAIAAVEKENAGS